MCQLGLMNRLNHLFKKMVKMQSPRMQCCMCALSVMSALFGMFMLSAGVCLVLNYNFLEVDTSGLPPNLHNEEGKKVVGIILICVGIAALGISGLVSILFYAACSRTPSSSSKEAAEKGEGPSRPSSEESQGRSHNHRHYHSNGTTQVRASPVPGMSGGRRSGGAAVGLSNGRRGNEARGRGPAAVATGRDGPTSSRSGMNGRNAAPAGSARPYRPGKKTRHGAGRFRNSLPSHPEEALGESHSLGVAASSSRRLAFPDRSGHVNEGAELDDDLAARGNLASGPSEFSLNPSVVIRVDSSYLNETVSPSQTSPQQGESDPELTKHSSGVVGAGATSEVSVGDDRDPTNEEGSGRMSRSTVDSLDTADGVVEESAEDAHKRLDSQMKSLLS